MVTDKDKLVCESQRTQTGGKGNLGSFVDYAVVKFAPGEQSTSTSCVKRLQGPTKTCLVLTGQSRGTSSQQLEES